MYWNRAAPPALMTPNWALVQRVDLTAGVRFSFCPIGCSGARNRWNARHQHEVFDLKNGPGNVGVDPGQYNALVLDTQGSELLVLQGARKIVRQFRFIKTEAADFESYRNCATVDQLCSYLESFGFLVRRKDRFAKRTSGGAYYDILFERA